MCAAPPRRSRATSRVRTPITASSPCAASPTADTTGPPATGTGRSAATSDAADGAYGALDGAVAGIATSATPHSTPPDGDAPPRIVAPELPGFTGKLVGYATSGIGSWWQPDRSAPRTPSAPVSIEASSAQPGRDSGPS